MCWDKGRLCWKIAKLFYFCHLKKLARPETFGPYYVILVILCSWCLTEIFGLFLFVVGCVQWQWSGLILFHLLRCVRPQTVARMWWRRRSNKTSSWLAHILLNFSRLSVTDALQLFTSTHSLGPSWAQRWWSTVIRDDANQACSIACFGDVVWNKRTQVCSSFLIFL